MKKEKLHRNTPLELQGGVGKRGWGKRGGGGEQKRWRGGGAREVERGWGKRGGEGCGKRGGEGVGWGKMELSTSARHKLYHLPSVETEASGRANHFPSGKKFSLSRELCIEGVNELTHLMFECPSFRTHRSIRLFKALYSIVVESAVMRSSSQLPLPSSKRE